MRRLRQNPLIKRGQSDISPSNGKTIISLKMNTTRLTDSSFILMHKSKRFRHGQLEETNEGDNVPPRNTRNTVNTSHR